MKIRNGDHVVVISGKDKGKTGTVLRVLPEKQRLVIGGINMRVKHVRGTPQRPGQRLEYEASIAASNVMLIDPKTKKRTRIGFSFTEKGVKQRVAKCSGEVLPTKTAAPAPAKKDATKKAASKVAEKKEAKETKEAGEMKEKASVAEEGKKLPAKKPFWKRVVNFSEEATGADVPETPHMKVDNSIPKDVTPMHRSNTRGS